MGIGYGVATAKVPSRSGMPLIITWYQKAKYRQRKRYHRSCWSTKGSCGHLLGTTTSTFGLSLPILALQYSLTTNFTLTLTTNYLPNNQLYPNPNTKSTSGVYSLALGFTLTTLTLTTNFTLTLTLTPTFVIFCTNLLFVF